MADIIGDIAINLSLLYEQHGLKLTQIHHEIIESLVNGRPTDRPAANIGELIYRKTENINVKNYSLYTC